MSYTALIHTHTLFVTLFVISILVKTVLLLMGNYNALDKYRNKMKVPEMILALIFVGLGVAMLVLSQQYMVTWFWIKIVVVLLTIPLGIIAFKKKIKPLGFLVLAMLMGILIYAFIR